MMAYSYSFWNQATESSSSDDSPVTQTAASLSSRPTSERKYLPGTRWAISPNNTDLSGKWKPVITSQFKQEFDEYLDRCGQSFLFRKMAMVGISYTREHIYQKNEGRELTIAGTNPAGSWSRTLIASGSDFGCCDDTSEANKNTCWKPIHADVKDHEGDIVQVEAWWEDNGRVHKSWLRGKARLQGGTLETTRYLDKENPDILFCESKFHPGSSSTSQQFRPTSVIWKYQRCKDE